MRNDDMRKSWYVSSGSGGQKMIVSEPDGKTLAVVYANENAENDAGLMASAPSLLASLEELVNCADSGRDFAELKRARAAIALAEGGAA